MKNRLLPLASLPRRILAKVLLRYLLRQILLKLFSKMGSKSLSAREKRELTQADFVRICERFGDDTASMAKYLEKTFHCRAVIDPNLIRVIKKLKVDFNLENFVETGTYDGDTSLFFSLIFDRVFTCDVVDWGRRPEFYLMDNLKYEIKSSPDFLMDHLHEIKAKSLFYLDAHWEPYWPLRDELSIVFGKCENPVVVMDDFDAGNGLFFDTYGGKRLDFEYIADFVPAGYKFFVNPWSNRNRGIIFLFPGLVDYGCLFQERSSYCEDKHGLWERV